MSVDGVSYIGLSFLLEQQQWHLMQRTLLAQLSTVYDIYFVESIITEALSL
jgi:hypothetical protein